MNPVRIALDVAGSELAAASLHSYITSDPLQKRRLALVQHRLAERWDGGKYRTDVAEGMFTRLVAGAVKDWQGQHRMASGKDVTARVVERLTRWFEDGQVEERVTVWEDKETLKIAKEVLAIDFPTKDAMDKYLDEHPDADRSNHRVVEKKDDSSAGGEKENKPTKTKKQIYNEYHKEWLNGTTQDKIDLLSRMGYKDRAEELSQYSFHNLPKDFMRIVHDTLGKKYNIVD